MRLRTKFLLSLLLISSLITAAVLLVVRYRVQLRVREELTRGVETSIVTFNRLQQQREQTLERSAALLAALPPLKAVMTSSDPATIQDASATFWRLAGSQLFVLADRQGQVSAFHSSVSGFALEAAQAGVRRYTAGGDARDWWFGGGHLFQVFLQPIFFGAQEDGYPIGVLAVGYEVSQSVADDVSRVASSDVGFAYDHRLVVTTVSQTGRQSLADFVEGTLDVSETPREVQLGGRNFLADTVRLSVDTKAPVTLTVLKSFDEASAFLNALNRLIVGIGIAGVAAGSLLVFFVSTTFTRPLERLLEGVRALETGDFSYPLAERGSDEVSELTTAFNHMRQQVQATQRQLIETERMATIGRMANTISHDLRRPLTAVQAYAEFLEERSLTDVQRRDYFQEIHIAVSHMMDQINSLLGFSRERQALHLAEGRLDEVIDRAVKTVKALPEYQALTVIGVGTECRAWFDPGKLERVLVNLLFNAAEAAPAVGGRIEVSVRTTDRGTEIRVSDNGPGIPGSIGQTLFEPFVSYGKQRGTGLGLAVVHNVMQQHGGEAIVERTGPDGTTFLLRLPSKPVQEKASTS